MAADGLSIDWYVTRHRTEDEVLPWDHISAGLHKDFLWQDWQGRAGRARPRGLPLDAVLRLRRLHRLRHRARRRLGRCRPPAAARAPARTCAGAHEVPVPARPPGPSRRAMASPAVAVGSERPMHGSGSASPSRARSASTSHRDVARIWERALRRAGSPSPTPRASRPARLHFGLALPTGYESDCEYLDVDLAVERDVRRRRLASLPARLTAALPVGFTVTAVAVRPAGSRRCSRRSRAAPGTSSCGTCRPPAAAPRGADRCSMPRRSPLARSRKGQERRTTCVPASSPSASAPPRRTVGHVGGRSGHPAPRAPSERAAGCVLP